MTYNKCPNCGYNFTNDELHKKITGCYTTKEIIEAIESSTLVEFTFRDDDSTNRNYYVDVTSATGLESTGYDERGSSTIMLVEP